MFDEIRNTILYHLKNIGLPIVDGIKKETQSTNSSISVIFNGFANEDKTQIKTYLADEFDLYNTKSSPDKIPISCKLKIVGVDEVKEVLGLENGTIEVKTPILSDVFEDFTKMTIYEETEGENISENEDYIQITQNSLFTSKKNYNLTEKYSRYDILFFLKGDGNDSKTNYYAKIISEIFDSNKKIINEDGEETSNLMYINERVQTDVFHNNVVDKILRCTMLVKYY